MRATQAAEAGAVDRRVHTEPGRSEESLVDAGDLAADTTISITTTVIDDPDVEIVLGDGEALGSSVAVFVFEPGGLVFDNSVTVTVVRDVSDLNESERNGLSLCIFEDPNFVDLGANCVVVEDPPSTFTVTCTVELKHFST